MPRQHYTVLHNPEIGPHGQLWAKYWIILTGKSIQADGLEVLWDVHIMQSKISVGGKNKHYQNNESYPGLFEALNF